MPIRKQFFLLIGVQYKLQFVLYNEYVMMI